ncbi:DNA polymerase III subunit epsilon [Pseudoxanthomonas kalamensis DSM 18571]|uniref:3'-5' exonuclease n=1 Tax=Pseudoxanthomonas kalamensis TaxID=289483 RepID=UPI0013917C6C|nr:3'-5' exonuclease [Pseudoxanthomonas kalamensis]KAF1712260.1 DNA polymerase III subunit epsilon [Pseudoxanthomonas kalamensis DSM 18571]
MGRRLQRWWLRRRHGHGEWAALLHAPPADEWVSLDLETTGLDPARDHILSLAAVPIRDGQVRLSERFERRVRPEREFDIESARHHRITPDEAAAGVPVRQAVREFLGWLGSRTLLGYYLQFDLSMLAPHVQAIAGFALPNARIDLADAVAEHERRARPDAIPNLDFAHIAEQLGVPVMGRHSALGDATTTALCWLALQARARGRGAGVGA